MYTLFVGVFLHKELTFKTFMNSLRTTSWLTGRVLVIVFTAYAFGRILTEYRIPIEIANWILSYTKDVNLVWCFVVSLLLFGMVMETLAIILLVTPVLLPVMAYGVDPIHFGVILVCCCGGGLFHAAHGGKHVYRGGHRRLLPGGGIPQGPAPCVCESAGDCPVGDIPEDRSLGLPNMVVAAEACEPALCNGVDIGG